MQNHFYPFHNLPLPYDYDGLEPYMDTKTMYLHHDRHLQTYIENLNAALKGHPALQEFPLEKLLMHVSALPDDLQKSIRNNGGGVYNHRFFFNGMEPPAIPVPALGLLETELFKTYGSYSGFKEAFTAAALSVFGSGYTWLVWNGKGLSITTTSNQDTPLEQNLSPILTLDVWEHAYYLKNYNLRKNYIENWFHVIN